jgi:hypothetical protein
MKKKEEKKQAVPVMKQLARPMSQQELATVAGAHSGGSNNYWPPTPGDIDYLN